MGSIHQVQEFQYCQGSTPPEWDDKCCCIKTPLKMTDRTPENKRIMQTLLPVIQSSDSHEKVIGTKWKKICSIQFKENMYKSSFLLQKFYKHVHCSITGQQMYKFQSPLQGMSCNTFPKEAPAQTTLASDRVLFISETTSLK